MSDIICGLATISGREEALKDAVLSIIGQVDKLIIYQNGYKEIFDFLDNEKIEVYSSIDTGIDMGDAGKFYKLSDYPDNYYLSIDDDLVYPIDYVSNIIGNLKNYNNSVIITHHGRILNVGALSYYKDSKVRLRCLDNVDNYQAIHFPGTGVMGFHTSEVKITFDYFKIPNMGDIWVGLYARENNIPIIVAPHKTGWIKQSYKFNLNNSIYNTSINNDSIQNKLIINFNKTLIIEPTVNIDNSDICLLIPSYNRYDKLVETLTNINEYHGLNVIVYNDGSDDDRYYTIESNFKNVKVLHNSKNNGKIGYNDTVKFLLNEGIKSNFNWFIYYADDMLLCENFTDHVKPLFDDKQIVNIFSLSSGAWNCSAYIDGLFTISKNGLKTMYNLIPDILVDVENKSTGVWSSVTRVFGTMKPKLNNIKLCCLNYSLCQHYGNDDSKLHPRHRLKNPMVAENFYDYFYGQEIKIISQSDIKTNGKNTWGATNAGQKKNGIPNGRINEPIPINKRKGNAPSNNNSVIEPYVESKPMIPIINSPIEHDKTKLDNIRKGLNNEKQSRITKINDDVFIAKTRKRNLRLGGR
jgi:hypothetical protein